MIDFLEEIFWELQDIPGLGFLRNIREQISLKRTQLQRKKDVIDNRRKVFTDRGSRLKTMRKGSKRRVE
jgi:hypothetical protein